MRTVRQVGFPGLRGHRIGAEERVFVDLRPVPAIAVDAVRPDLHQGAADAHGAAQHDAGDGAGGDAHRGFARRGTAAAAIVADAVFQVVGQVGVARAELLGDRGIVARPLVLVLDQQADRRAGGDALEHAGQDADLVGFLPLGGEFRLARAALVQPGLDVGLGQRQQRRAAIDHAADRRPVAFAPCRDPEQMAETVVRHDGAAVSLPRWRCRARPDVSCRRCGSRNRRDAPPRSRPTTGRTADRLRRRRLPRSSRCAASAN